MLRDRRVAQVQLDKLVMAFPAVVPKAVVVARIAVKVDVEPIFIGGIPLFFLYVAECPEAAADMVKYAVQDDAYAVFVQCFTDRRKILICAKAAVDFAIVAGVVAVAVGVKNR